MSDNSSYKKLSKNIPISVIQEKTSQATKILLNDMLLSNRYPGARKREFVGARQISMTLSKKYTKLSLAAIGNHHGGRDHATVLHACKTVNNLLDSKDAVMLVDFNNTLDLLVEWNINRNDFKKPTLNQLMKQKRILENELNDINVHINKLLVISFDNKLYIVKSWIRNHVPLEIRQKILIKLS